MKKIIGILLPILCLNLGVLSSCGNETTKINLTYGDINASKVTKIEALDIVNKIRQKENFMFAVASKGCTCWSDFRTIVENYISSNHLICYYIEYDAFKDVAGQYGILLSNSSTTFVIIDNGEIKIQMHSTENPTMQKPEEFKKFMDANVGKPHAYFVNESNVESIKASGKSAIVYFERSQCEDCLYLNPSVINPYFKTYKGDQNLYILDCQPWKELSDIEYQAKKDSFGLSTKNNEKFGYNKGVFPFFLYLNNGNYESGAEAFNVTIDKNDGKYIISESYYSEERVKNLDYLTGLDGTRAVLNGLEVPESDLTVSGNWDHEKSIKYYSPLVNRFLDYYLPKVTYKF